MNSTSNKSLARWAVIIGIGIFATNLAQPSSLNYFLRRWIETNDSGCGLDMAEFFALGSLPWYFKMLFGLVMDSVPLLGTRRRYYLVFSATCASALWLALSKSSSPQLTIIAINTMLVIGSTAVGGLIVEAGQIFKAAGRLVSVRNFVESGCALLAGPLSAKLALLPVSTATAMVAAISFSIVPIAMIWLREPTPVTYDKGALKNIREKAIILFGSPSAWGVGLFMFLAILPQGIQTPLYCYQEHGLNLSIDKIGNFAAISAAAGLLASPVYALICARLSLGQLLVIGIISAAVSVLVYAFYDPRTSVEFFGLNGFLIAIHIVSGFLSIFSLLALMQLAVWATPTATAATGFAFFMSFLNAGISTGDVLGTTMVQRWSFNFHTLAGVYAIAAASLVCLLILMPRRLFSYRDGELQSAPLDGDK